MVSVYYPSGKKSTLVTLPAYMSICKAFVDHSPNMDKIIIHQMSKLNTTEFMHTASELIKEECVKICKRGSPTIFQKKDLEHFLQFSWENVHKELTSISPSLLSAVSAIVCDKPLSIQSKPFSHIMLTAAIGLHGRNQEMSVVQYLIGFILTRGGCAQRDIERLSKIGICTHPQTIQAKLNSWQKKLDQEIIDIKNNWANGGNTKFQLVGDNWDKNILPSYRTSDRRTLSLHLFNLYAIIDRVVPEQELNASSIATPNLNSLTFIPSVQEQKLLMTELTFIFGTSIIKTLPQISQYFQDIYPVHLHHRYSEFAGMKTTQYPLGLYDCNENKTQEMIQLLKKLSDLYVPCKDGEIVEPVFFGDERVQGAQNAMSNARSAIERLEGFISKIEDFHRLMNFLEAIHKLSYSTESGADPGTMYYYRNLLNMRNVKGNVKNAYRPYKQLYYTVLDGLCLLLFLDFFEIKDLDSEIPLPVNFQQMSNEDKVKWLNTVCSEVLKKWFFENTNDVCASIRDVLDNPEHAENYWVSSLDDNRLKCHFCPKSYAYVGSLKSHEKKVHNVEIKEPKKSILKKADKLQDYLIMVFKLTLLHKNLDSAVDMGDGEPSVRSAKYEIPIYNKTNKTKYTIGSIHLTALTSGIRPPEQTDRLIANRFVNLQGGRNNNIALDEYLEMLNRDSKTACSGHQTKESIINHSKQYPLLINLTEYFDEISELRKRKGFHHLPSYTSDVHSIVKDLLQLDIFKKSTYLKFKGFKVDRNPFDNCVTGLSNMIQRHTPKVPFHRLRNPHI